MASTLAPIYGSSPEHAKAIKNSGDEEKKLREACQGFEAIFMHKIMQSMRATESESGLIKKSNAEKIFTDMLDEELSNVAAVKSVNGIADIMFEQLKNTLLTTGDNTGTANTLTNLKSYAPEGRSSIINEFF